MKPRIKMGQLPGDIGKSAKIAMMERDPRINLKLSKSFRKMVRMKEKAVLRERAKKEIGERVEFPEFELVGPPCTETGCDGVLVDHVTIRAPKEFFRRCAKCGAESGRMPAREALAHAGRVIERALRGEKIS